MSTCPQSSLPLTDERGGAGQLHSFSREEAEVLCRVLAIAGLVEQSSAAADDAVAAGSASTSPPTLQRFRFRKFSRNSARLRDNRTLTASSSTAGLIARSRRRRPRACGGESGWTRRGSGASEQPCGKAAEQASAELGTISTGRIPAFAATLVRRFIHGDKFHPQPVNHGSGIGATRASSRESAAAPCWQFRKPRLNPAVPPTNYNINLLLNIYKGEKRVARSLPSLRTRRRTSLCFPCFAVSGAILRRCG